ncbi:MAG: hypothetical protein F4X81_15015 [Gammaproteobacteria bacterium]|nr:hypothetical protein [Gammaproteobacteria bacterium]MYE52769.1 hypothetical protein [Gammaproteobacteria bacterium]
MAKRTKKGRRRHDAAFKNLYAFALMVWDLMEVVLPPALFEALDFNTLERLPAEWFGFRLERRLGDTVWRVGRHGGGSLIMPIEYQRRPDARMPLRVSTYKSLLLENLARRGELNPEEGPLLVRPVVLYNGLRPWRGPTSLADLLQDGGTDWPGLKLVDMSRIKVDDLPEGNKVALQIEVHQGALAHDSDAVLGRVSERLGGPALRDLRVAFAEWIWHSLAPGVPKVPKMKSKLRKIAELGEFQEMKSFMLKSMVDHWLAEGRELGVTQARADERALLCRQAGRKFGGHAAQRLSARIEGVTDPKRLAEVGDWIIDCGTEAEFLDRAKNAKVASPESAN